MLKNTRRVIGQATVWHYTCEQKNRGKIICDGKLDWLEIG